MPSPGVKRAVRVAERVRKELALVIATEIRDPRAAGVNVTRVEMTDDLRTARVFFSLLTGGDDPKIRSEAEVALAGASGMIRREVSSRVGLRYAPDLRFIFDNQGDKITAVERVLAEIRDEEKARNKQ